jgi:hypothetical protein
VHPARLVRVPESALDQAKEKLTLRAVTVALLALEAPRGPRPTLPLVRSENLDVLAGWLPLCVRMRSSGGGAARSSLHRETGTTRAEAGPRSPARSPTPQSPRDHPRP